MTTPLSDPPLVPMAALFRLLLQITSLPKRSQITIASFSGRLRNFFSSVGPLQPKVEDPSRLLQPAAAEEFDFFPAHCGQLVGPGERYKIVRLLGAGSHSTVHLAEDLQYVTVSFILHGDNKLILRRDASEHEIPVAIKILTAQGTTDNRSSGLSELATLQALRLVHDRSFLQLPFLRDHFDVSGPRGDHLCLVFTAETTTVDGFRRSLPSRVLRPHLVQLIATAMIESLLQLHQEQIIHASKI